MGNHYQPDTNPGILMSGRMSGRMSGAAAGPKSQINMKNRHKSHGLRAGERVRARTGPKLPEVWLNAREPTTNMKNSQKLQGLRPGERIREPSVLFRPLVLQNPCLSVKSAVKFFVFFMFFCGYSQFAFLGVHSRLKTLCFTIKRTPYLTSIKMCAKLK